MQTISNNELELGVLYEVESPIDFYHVCHHKIEEECHMQERINTTSYSRSHTLMMDIKGNERNNLN